MLNKFINPQQLQVLNGLIEESEEAQFFVDKLEELTQLITSMPVTYDTEANNNPLAVLHYFDAGMDFYIIEKDINPDQNQAFGYANLGYGYEAGYINIVELLGLNGGIAVLSFGIYLSNVEIVNSNRFFNKIIPLFQNDFLLISSQVSCFCYGCLNVSFSTFYS